MVCPNCGKLLNGESKFCDGCGSPVVSEQNNSQTNTQSAPAKQVEQENKVIFILSYILFFLPLVSCPGSKAGRFHANQGLLLLITSIAGQIVVTILTKLLMSISWGLWTVASLIGWAWVIVVLAFVVIGMINANKGEQKPLPVIGKIITIIK
jgi:uncharacterized membrane protein